MKHGSRSEPDDHDHCRPGDHSRPPGGRPPDAAALERAAGLFRAMGDGPRLRILHFLLAGECCVTAIVDAMGEKFPTVSQRLRVLRSEGLVSRRRERTHVYYALADRHVADLVANALDHAGELEAGRPPPPGPPAAAPFGGRAMSHAHPDHDHTHGPDCGHTAVKHGDHVDYLHDGHLHHHAAGGAVEEHALPVDAANPAACTPAHSCGAHPADHVHGPGCGHEAVPHGDHTDYLVGGHLHHPHGGHCDDHGPVSVVK